MLTQAALGGLCERPRKIFLPTPALRKHASTPSAPAMPQFKATRNDVNSTQSNNGS